MSKGPLLNQSSDISWSTPGSLQFMPIRGRTNLIFELQINIALILHPILVKVDSLKFLWIRSFTLYLWMVFRSSVNWAWPRKYITYNLTHTHINFFNYFSVMLRNVYLYMKKKKKTVTSMFYVFAVNGIKCHCAYICKYSHYSHHTSFRIVPGWYKLIKTHFFLPLFILGIT